MSRMREGLAEPFWAVSFLNKTSLPVCSLPVNAMIKCGCSIQSLLKYKTCLWAGRLSLRIAYVPQNLWCMAARSLSAIGLSL